jgi:hypothetical protein
MVEGEGQQPSSTEQGNTPAQKPETAQKLGSPENREVAEQQKQLVENIQELRNNLGQLSEYNPATPLSQETKEKLNKVEEGMNEHELAGFIAGLSAVGSGVLEGLNYFNSWGAPPGAAATVLLGFGGISAATVEIGASASKGIDKLKGLIARNKEPRGNTT